MNILIVYPTPFIQGKDSFYYFYKQLIDWLATKGMESQLYFAYLRKNGDAKVEGIQLPDSNQFNTRRNLEALNCFVSDKNVNVLFSFNNTIFSVYSLFEHIKRNNHTLKIINLIHSCPNHVVLLKRRLLTNSDFSDFDKSIKGSVIRKIPGLYLCLLGEKMRRDSRKEYHLYDATVVLSASYIAEYLSLLGYSQANKVFAISNPLPPASFYPPIIEVEDKQKEVIFVGRFGREKGLPALLRIWKKVETTLPDWKLVLVGDGELMPYCLDFAKTHHLQRVEFRGALNARPFINQASILCLTSAIEGLPTVFTEAMAMGVVPIGFDSFSAIHDMIDNWVNGVIIPAFDEQRYADALIELATNAELRYRISKSAIDKVQQYNINNIAPLWLEVFNKLGI